MFMLLFALLGCAEPKVAADADHDGVTDKADACPKTRIDRWVNTKGCSAEQIAKSCAVRVPMTNLRNTSIYGGGCSLSDEPTTWKGLCLEKQEGAKRRVVSCDMQPPAQSVDCQKNWSQCPPCTAGMFHGEYRAGKLDTFLAFSERLVDGDDSIRSTGDGVIVDYSNDPGAENKLRPIIWQANEALRCELQVEVATPPSALAQLFSGSKTKPPAAKIDTSDGDYDGVANERDLCAKTPKNGIVNSLGCNLDQVAASCLSINMTGRAGELLYSQCEFGGEVTAVRCGGTPKKCLPSDPPGFGEELHGVTIANGPCRPEQYGDLNANFGIQRMRDWAETPQFNMTLRIQGDQIELVTPASEVAASTCASYELLALATKLWFQSMYACHFANVRHNICTIP